MESIESVLRIAQVVLGIGLVIFVHEAGHFLAARFCGVRVEIFSLGFGPKLLGWRRGATLYQVAAIPLGGFVKMAGDEGGDARAPRPDELGGKTVGQRFLIYSGGVLANVAFALLVFPVLFLIGVPFTSPTIGGIHPGSPAWRAGLEAGTRVLAVNGNEVHDFSHIPNEIALGPPERASLLVLAPGAEKARTIELVPRYDESLGFFTIGVLPASDPEGTMSVVPDSPATAAGLRDGDRLRRVLDAPQAPTLDEALYLATSEGGPLRLEVEREGRTFEAEIQPRSGAPAGAPLLGVAPLANVVAGLRGRALAAGLDLREGDRLLAAQGRPIVRPGDLVLALAGGSSPLRLDLERDGARRSVQGPTLTGAEALAFARDIALDIDRTSTRVAVRQGSAAQKAGLQDGDRVLRIGDADVASFEELSERVKDSGAKAVRLTVLRADALGGSQLLEIEATPTPLATLEYGLGLEPARYVFRTSGPLQALRVGVRSSWKFAEEAWLSLKRILLGQVSAKNVGGIVTIGVVSHNFASLGLVKLFFFLCMLSMNLAFINVLPIPVLDGGHLLFLVVEKLKGSPVSERVLSYSQIVGLVLIVALMAFVTFNDLERLFRR